MTKTNVMRLLDAAKIPYRAAEYEVDENDLNGMHAAEGIGMPPEQIFKTLVAKGERGGYAVFCIPVWCVRCAFTCGRTYKVSNFSYFMLRCGNGRLVLRQRKSPFLSQTYNTVYE